ncbi:recombinase family protein [Roseovarius sp. MMSF_3350]|uniref:recombinase family protein n=1 Tax=Roseovarius sp. MMSF_3350 TaxID=3046706 RepID=UPI00273F521D|nr:recombinase family protein [Roseovarius sp. MMSF_3350]
MTKQTAKSMTETARPQAVIYCRVSSKAQEAEGHGLKSQETRCREYAVAQGYDVAGVFPDTFTGGGDFMARPGLVALLSFLDAQPDQDFVVIFDDLKRFARDTRFHLDLREALRQRGASIECLNFKFDDSPEGEFIETIMAAQGALERKQNGRQVGQKMKARMQTGYWVHNAPTGYRYKTVKGHGKVLVHDEPMASLVKEALEGYAAGRFQGQVEVKRFFEAHPDFPRSKHGDVKQQRVTDILTQPLYAGYICSETWGIDWLKGQHEPLISLATYDKIQKRRSGVAKAPARKDIGKDFALRGFATCGDCGVPLRSSWPKGARRHYAYYLCQTKGCASYGKSIPRDKLEGDFGEIVKTLQPGHSVMKLATLMFRDAWAARLGQAKAASEATKRQIAETDKQIEKLLDRIMAATNDAVIGAYEDKITALEKTKVRLQDSLANRAKPKGTVEELLELSLRFLANPYKLWESGNITLRRTLLRLAFADRFAYHRLEGPRTPQIALPFKALKVVEGVKMRSGAGEGT